MSSGATCTEVVLSVYRVRTLVEGTEQVSQEALASHDA